MSHQKYDILNIKSSKKTSNDAYLVKNFENFNLFPSTVNLV